MVKPFSELKNRQSNDWSLRLGTAIYTDLVDDALQYDAHQHCKQILFILLWILLSFVPLSSNSSIRQHRTTYQTAVIDYHHTHIIECIWCCKAMGFCESANSVSKENDTWNKQVSDRLLRTKRGISKLNRKQTNWNWLLSILTKDLANSFKRLLNGHSKNKTQNEFWLRKAKQRVERKKVTKLEN